MNEKFKKKLIIRKYKLIIIILCFVFSRFQKSTDY